MTEAETKFEISSEAISQVIFPKGVAEPKEENLLSSEEIPSWLNEAFIENVLRSFYDDEDLKVRCLKIQQCGGKGDSYASVMFRVGTYFSEGKNLKSIKFRSYIVKTLPVADIAMEKLGANNYNVQDKEMDMYKKVLPEFKTLLKSINEDADIFPTCLAVDKDLDVIVLEDLAEKNFVMADRTKGLDQDHILMALRKMARMHAASAVVYSKDPESISSFDTGFFTRKTDAFHVMFETLCEGLIEEMASWEGFEYYAKKLPNVRKSLVKTARRAFDCDEGDFHVLTHGDLWTNNLMYRYNESGNPIDSVLLDFQFTCYGSPALDLIYFLYTSTVDELRQEKMEELVQYYYYELQSLLSKLNYDMKAFPSLHEFNIQVLKKSFYAFTSCLLIFPVMISKDEDADFLSLMGRDDRSLGFKRRIFQNPAYQKVAKKIISKLDTMGILDEM